MCRELDAYKNKNDMKEARKPKCPADDKGPFEKCSLRV